MISDFERSAILLDDVNKVYAVKVKAVINDFKTFLWKVEGLFDEITIGVFHETGFKLKEANVSDLD